MEVNGPRIPLRKRRASCFGKGGRFGLRRGRRDGEQHSLWVVFFFSFFFFSLLRPYPVITFPFVSGGWPNTVKVTKVCGRWPAGETYARRRPRACVPARHVPKTLSMCRRFRASPWVSGQQRAVSSCPHDHVKASSTDPVFLRHPIDWEARQTICRITNTTHCMLVK